MNEMYNDDFTIKTYRNKSKLLNDEDQESNVTPMSKYITKKIEKGEIKVSESL